MKILVAMDAFKGSLTSEEANQIAAKGLCISGNEVKTLAVADGGEGSVDALLNVTGDAEEIRVHNLAGDVVDITVAYLEECQTAVIETASMCGIHFLDATDKTHPLHTSSYGLGEAMRWAVHHLNIDTLVLMLGGTGVLDAGIGMGEALGVRYYDKNGEELHHVTGIDLARIAKIDATNAKHLLNGIEIKIGTDVEAPLVGPKGAVCLFGPQKGLELQELPLYNEAMQHFVHAIGADSVNGDGAAGGIAFFLRFVLHGKIESGFELLKEYQDWAGLLTWADLVITGEGRIDDQTVLGKLPVRVADCAYRYQTSVIALCGALHLSQETLRRYHIDAGFSIMQSPSSVKDAMSFSREWLLQTAEGIGGILNLVQKV